MPYIMHIVWRLAEERDLTDRAELLQVCLRRWDEQQAGT